jgi:type IV pilus assembly protein PilW
MIALVISSIVLLGVATVYSSTKRSYKIQTEMARLQENVRYAFDILARDVRGAGYAGCNPKINRILNTTDDSLYDFQAGIAGFEYTATSTGPGSDYTITTLTGTGTASDWEAPDGSDADTSKDNLPSELAGNVLIGTDVLITKSADTVDGLIPSGNTPANSASITFPNAHNIPAGTIVIFSDCEKADVFQNNSGGVSLTRPTAGDPGNVNPASTNWSHEYTTDARIQIVKSRAYFIGPGASGEPALFRMDFSKGNSAATAEELVEGIESMQVLYGEDLSPNDPDIQPTRYVTADNVTNWDNVISVKVSLLARTPQELNRPQKTNTYRLMGVDDATSLDVTTLNDRRIRKVFTTTLFLRNKGLYRESF